MSESPNVDTAGGSIRAGLGDRAVVVDGGPGVLEGLAGPVGGLLSGVVSPSAPAMPADLDSDTAELVLAWLAGAEPA